MKKLFTVCIYVGCYIFATGQVGINTDTPQTLFHVDGAGDNPVTTPSLVQQANDFVITPSGNVGIGTIAPTVKLDIESSTNPAVKIVDGAQSKGKVLTSDSAGNAGWQNVALYRILGTLGAGINIPLGIETTNFAQTGASITLPPGKWQVAVTMLLNVPRGTDALSPDQWVWLRTTFTEFPSTPVALNGYSPDIVGGYLISGLFSGPLTPPVAVKYSMLSGSVVINNQTASSKTYYYVAGSLMNDEENASLFGAMNFQGFAGSSTGENSIVATLVQ